MTSGKGEKRRQVDDEGLSHAPFSYKFEQFRKGCYVFRNGIVRITDRNEKRASSERLKPRSRGSYSAVNMSIYLVKVEIPEVSL